MSASNKSYRQIFHNTSIIGGATVVSYLTTLLTTKYLALFLGPSGIGQIGLLSNFMGICAGIAALGIGTSGTRHIAAVNVSANAASIMAARRAIFVGSVLLATIGAAVVWLARDSMALYFLKDPGLSSALVWISAGVWLMVMSSWPHAIITGSHRVADIAAFSIINALVVAAIILFSLFIFDSDALLLVVLAPPMAAFCVGLVFVWRQPRLIVARVNISEIVVHWRILAPLGSAYVLVNLVQAVGFFLVRMRIKEYLSVDDLGLFEAAWLLSTFGVNILYRATGSDFYPRLAGVVDNKPIARQMLREQTDVLQHLAAPVILMISGFSEVIIQVIYSSSFVDASNLLKLLVFGTLFRVIAYPFGYLLLASANAIAYIFIECILSGIFVMLVYLFPLSLNLEKIGFYWCLTSVLYLMVVFMFAVLSIDVKRSDVNFNYVFLIALMLFLIYGVAQVSTLFSALAAMSFSVAAIVMAILKFRKI